MACSGLQISVDGKPTAVVISGGPEFMRGDSNVDGSVILSNAVFFLGYLFPTRSSNQLTCLDASDADGNEAISIADVIS